MKYIVFKLFFLTTLLSCGQTDTSSLKTKAQDALIFAKANKMDTTISILIDMNIASGKYRMFVYDLQKDSILLEGLCAHGSGTSYSSNDKPVFSNVEESHCSSLGKYKIGVRGYSSWGIHVNYRLHGLESTNNNAYKRNIVLHSWEGITDDEISPQVLAQSWGCPTVSDNVMRGLDAFLKTKTQPVLLWIYN